MVQEIYILQLSDTMIYTQNKWNASLGLRRSFRFKRATHAPARIAVELWTTQVAGIAHSLRLV